MTKLSDDLQSIYQLELNYGNEVERLDEPAGTACPYAVVFKRPLHKAEIERDLRLPATVKYWESRDLHYEKQAGYYSELTRQAVSGPLSS